MSSNDNVLVKAEFEKWLDEKYAKKELITAATKREFLEWVDAL